jgi:hypothetical protein
MKPSSLGFAAVNGIKIYHEIYGEGEPLVLIHGGLTTIGQMQGWGPFRGRHSLRSSPPHKDESVASAFCCQFL